MTQQSQAQNAPRLHRLVGLLPVAPLEEGRLFPGIAVRVLAREHNGFRSVLVMMQLWKER